MASEFYYYNDSFFGEVEEIFEDMNFEEMADDFVAEVEDCELRPIYKMDHQLFFELLSSHFEENSTEDGSEWDAVFDIVKKHMNFDELNEAAPCLYFPNGVKTKYTKSEIIAMWPNEETSTK